MAPTDLGSGRPMPATSCVFEFSAVTSSMGELSVSDSFQKIFWADCSRTAAACPHACLDLSDEARRQSYSLALYFWGEMTAATRMAGLHEAPLSCGSVQKFALTLHLLFSTCSVSLMQGAGQGKHAG